MSDWQVGDRAVCVDDGPVKNRYAKPALKLRRGNVYEVTGIRVCTDGLGLLLDGEPPHSGRTIEVGWNAARFRKIRPDEPVACEEEFQNLVKRSKVEAWIDDLWDGGCERLNALRAVARERDSEAVPATHERSPCGSPPSGGCRG